MLPQTVTRPILPREDKDRVFFAILAIGIPFALFWLCLVVLPYYHNTIDSTAAFHLVAALFVAGNIAANVFLAIRTDPSGKAAALPAILKRGWQYCPECLLNSPPRSYHCKICQECILKRDHHCRFLGSCIGHRNHRFYFVALFYIWFGAAYGVFYHWDFCFRTLDFSALGFFLCLLAPHFAFVFFQVSLFQLIVVVLQDLGTIALGTTTYLLVLQLVAIYRGQTLYERKHNVMKYDLGPARNFKAVLGRRWLAVWFLPFADSPLPGDGTSFTLAEELQEVKDI